ncbi:MULTISPECIES: type IA DNA topoisomerase [Bacillota]|uniref:type IA DNA topoisomerase n=1 Tax=Bacillota TaxID=1239 RepID=UPI0039F015E6
MKISGKVLICAEKPDQAKKIADPFPNKHNGDHIVIEPCDMFPKGAIVISACGHVLELYAPSDYSSTMKEWTLKQLPIIPKEYKLKVSDSKKFYFNSFKKFLKDTSISMVIHAGDPEQEGQLLIDEILYFLNNKKPVMRLWTTSLTKESIVKAFKNLRNNKEFIGYYNAAVARQRADWVVGISSSRCLTILLNQKGIPKTFSAGRVQTALTSLIYQREREIETFKSQPYWDCFIDVRFGGEKLIGKWFNNVADHIFEHESAQALVDFCKLKEAQVYSVTKEEIKVRPPQFYNLSSLQMEANRLYGMSPVSVLNFCQSLYDKSLISYPRSDSRHLTQEEAKWLPTVLENLSKVEDYSALIKGATKDISNDKRYIDESKVSDHYGIVLTEEFVDPGSLPKGEQLIYDLIAKSIIAAHYQDHIYDTTEVILAVQHRFTFKSKGRKIKEKGWKVVYQEIPANPPEKEEDSVEIPELIEGQTGSIYSVELKEGETSAPSRFTQGDLIKIMTNAGRYVSEREDFKNTELSLGTEATRANIVATVTSRYVKVHKNLVYMQPEGRVLIEALGQNNYLTSVLTTGRMERYLEQIRMGKGSVSDFIQRTEQVTRMVIDKLISEAPTWRFGDYVKEIQEAEEIGRCKICGATVLDKGNFFGCSSYKETQCNFKIPKQILGKSITKENARKLLDTGTTALIKGFQKKDKSATFDAFLSWDSNNKTIIFRNAK